MNFSYGKKCTVVNSMRCDVSSKWAEINERAYIPEALSFCQINNHLASPARHNGELEPDRISEWVRWWVRLQNDEKKCNVFLARSSMQQISCIKTSCWSGSLSMRLNGQGSAGFSLSGEIGA